MDKRSFPRYDILSLNAFIRIGEEQIWVKNLSLGGLQLFHTKPLILEENQEVIFYLGKKFIRKLFIKEVWSQDSMARSENPKNTPDRLTQKLNNITHIYGVSLYFEEYVDHKNWRVLVQAMHKYQIKT